MGLRRDLRWKMGRSVGAVLKSVAWVRSSLLSASCQAGQITSRQVAAPVRGARQIPIMGSLVLWPAPC